MAQTPQSSMPQNLMFSKAWAKKPELVDWSNTALTISRAVKKGELMWPNFPWFLIRNSSKEQTLEEYWGVFLLLWKSLITPHGDRQIHRAASLCNWGSSENSLLKIICFVQQQFLWLLLSVVLQAVGKANFPSQISVCAPAAPARLWFPACPGTSRGIYRVGDINVTWIKPAWDSSTARLERKDSKQELWGKKMGKKNIKAVIHWQRKTILLLFLMFAAEKNLNRVCSLQCSSLQLQPKTTYWAKGWVTFLCTIQDRQDWNPERLQMVIIDLREQGFTPQNIKILNQHIEQTPTVLRYLNTL